MATPIIATTQDHLEVEDVLDDLVLLKDGSAAMVIKTNAINFGLLSEEEQDSIIYAYAAFLNSLTFSVQILIRSDLKDISGYLRLLEDQEVKQANPMKKAQIKSYQQFVKSLVTERNVLQKKFYLVIPFSSLELGVSKSITSSIGKKRSSPLDKNYIIEKAKTSLEPKKNHIMSQLARLGLVAKQLNTEELIQLLFTMYNPSSHQGQRIVNTKDYSVPLVQPAYINQQETIMTDTTVSPTPPSPISTPPMPEPASTPIPPTPPSPAAPSMPTPAAPTESPIMSPPTPTTPVGAATEDAQSAIDSAVSGLKPSV